MRKAYLDIARKVILCVGLLVSALLFIYPHWRMSVNFGGEFPAYDQDLGRAFIASPPLAGIESRPFELTSGNKFVARINYVRQITEVWIALLFTFGLMRALKLRKPERDRDHDAE